MTMRQKTGGGLSALFALFMRGVSVAPKLLGLSIQTVFGVWPGIVMWAGLVRRARRVLPMVRG
jgi:hypothetical protein